MNRFSKKTINEILSSLKVYFVDWYFFFLLISFLLFKYTFSSKICITAKIFIALLIPFFYFMHHKKTSESMPAKFERFSFYPVFILLSLSILAYVAMLVGDVTLSLILLFTTPTLLLFGLVLSYGLSLMNSKRKVSLIFSYIMLCLSTIVFFGFIFSLAPLFNSNLSYAYKEGNVTGMNDLLYFSAQTYYASSYGDVYPVGDFSRLASIFEVAFSFIIHVIILGLFVKENRNG